MTNATTNIVKVQYYSETTGELSPREYTYYSMDCLKVGDIVIVPVRDTTGKAKVSAIDVPEAEIANFKDKVKTILAGSKIVDVFLEKDIEEAEAENIPVEIERSYTPNREAMKAALNVVLAPVNLAEGLTPVAPETALALRPGEDIEVRGYHAESVKLLKYAKERVITTLDHTKVATDDLSIISNLKKAMGDKRQEYLSPLKIEMEAINNTYKELMSPILEADRLTREKMVAFNNEQARIRREQEEINRKRMEAAQQEAALNNGELTESVNLVEVAEVTGRVHTDIGTSGMRDNWKYRVVNLALVLREYLVLDTAMMNAIAKKHHDQKEVPGIEFYNEPIIAVRSR